MTAMTTEGATVAARHQIINQQVRTWDVLDAAVLAAQERVARECFVPAALKHVAYADAPIPLGDGQHLWPAKLDGRVLQALKLKAHESVLEIGTGSGYLSACLAQLGARVVSLEINPRLANSARQQLSSQCIQHVSVLNQDVLTYSPRERYDAIIFTAAVETVPAPVLSWLNPNGRLIAPVGQARQTMTLYHRGLPPAALFETAVDALIQPASKHFVF